MLSLSYTITPALKSSLEKIELVRKNILSTPLSHSNRLRFQWNAQIGKVYYSLALSGHQLSRTRMAKILSILTKKKTDREEQEVIGYKKALDYINRQWYVTEKQITSKDILNLYTELVLGGVDKAQVGMMRASDKAMSYFLDYLQSYPESPIIQAAIAQAEIFDISPFLKYNDRLARLISILFLYKYGYDFGGFLNLEEKWFSERIKYESMTNMVIKGQKITPWIEYFVQTSLDQLEITLQNLIKTKFSRDLTDAFWRLNDRQKEILTLLEHPGNSITNRSVQKMFRISQITASRDLSKMATLGLVFSHGKGRSVYYTRAV